MWNVAWCTKGDTFPGDMRGVRLSLCLAGVRSGDEKHLVGLLVKLLDELIDRPKLHDAGEAVGILKSSGKANQIVGYEMLENYL